MPFLNISTNKKIENEQELLAKSSHLLSSTLNKSENFVMFKLTDSLPMYFAGTEGSCCFV